jgi:hypothetical protein
MTVPSGHSIGPAPCARLAALSLTPSAGPAGQLRGRLLAAAKLRARLPFLPFLPLFLSSAQPACSRSAGKGEGSATRSNAPPPCPPKTALPMPDLQLLARPTAAHRGLHAAWRDDEQLKTGEAGHRKRKPREALDAKRCTVFTGLSRAAATTNTAQLSANCTDSVNS